MKKTYVPAEISLVCVSSEDVISASGLIALDPLKNPITENLDVNELPIF